MPFDKHLKRSLIEIMGKKWVKDDPITCYSYRCDGLTLHPALPMGVIYPGNTDDLIDAVLLFNKKNISFLPRGAGTGLSGGAVPVEGSVLIEMFRFNQIHEINDLNRTMVVGPGVVNQEISDVAAPYGLRFAPDPSSQKACTIGGNVGENSGGPHTLKYGVTVNHIVGLEMVLADGTLVNLGGEAWAQFGPDLLALVIGSEGTFGIVTKVTCKLIPLPEKVNTLLAVFRSVGDASRAVSAIIREGMIPAALEMIDQVVIQAVERSFNVGFPLDAAAVLIIELEGCVAGLPKEAEQITSICKEHGAREVKAAKDEKERALIWRARKEALGAIGTISPSFYTQDGVIPRAALPEVLDRMLSAGNRLGLTIANVFHAGDGNLHPLILYNSQDPEEIKKVHELSDEILSICLEVGGTLSGEHGIGLEKSSLINRVFREQDLDNMLLFRAVFNPRNLLNPGKIFPNPGRCLETKNLVKGKTGVLP